MARFLSVFVLLLSFSTTGFAQVPGGYSSYCNNRFGYCLNYPRSMTPQPESGSGDGRVFKDEKTGATLAVWGRNTTNPAGGEYSLEEQYAGDLQQFQSQPDRQVSYHTLGKGFFVISGYVAGNVFYQKVVRRGDTFGYAYLEYPQKAKKQYDAVSVQVYKSFR